MHRFYRKCSLLTNFFALSQTEWGFGALFRTRKEKKESSEMTDDSMCLCRNDPSITDSNERTDIVELLEAIAYLICQDDPVTPESYHRILSSRYTLNFPKRRGILK